MAEEKKKNKITKEGLRKVLKLFKYIHPYRFEYTIGLLFLLGSSLAGLAFPELMGNLVNAGNEGSIGDDLNRIAIIIGALFLIQVW